MNAKIIPAHVAIMMDGNGRWAKQRNQPRSFGHKQGGETLVSTIKAASELDIKYLTIFAFSTENWKRPVNEVCYLMQLLVSFFAKYRKIAIENNIRVRILGDKEKLDNKVQKCILDIEQATKECSGLNLQLAINYGGRDDLLRAFKHMHSDLKSGRISLDQMNYDMISRYLDTKDLPEPDLFIRTGGDKRLSNFLLWQFAYTEFIFLDVLWPDFTKEDFENSIRQFGKRERRFGEIHEGGTSH